MRINNLLYKFNKNILPFKTAIITVVIAVMASFCVSTISETGKKFIYDEMSSMGLNGLAAVIYNYKGENITDTLFYKKLNSLNNIDKAAPIITETATVEFNNNTELSAVCLGIDTDIKDIIGVEATDGRMINNYDIESNARVCLVDENIAYSAYKRNNISGKKIQINIGDKNIDFTIIGVIRKNSNILNSISGNIIPDFIYIPYTTMLDLSLKSVFDQILFTDTNSGSAYIDYEEKLKENNYTMINKYLNITDLAGQKSQINNIVNAAFTALFLVAGVAIIVCSMSVASSVNTVVISKRKDIGIKLSMGAGNTEIITELIISAVLSCFIGVIIALILNFTIFKIFLLITDFNIVFDFGLIVITIFATIILTSIFSFIPSYKASKMPVIQALNRE